MLASLYAQVCAFTKYDRRLLVQPLNTTIIVFRRHKVRYSVLLVSDYFWFSASVAISTLYGDYAKK